MAAPLTVDVFVGVPGPRGPHGSQWYSGTGPPAADLGEHPQDHYLDAASGDVWVLFAPPGPVEGADYGFGPYGSGPYGGV